MKIRSAYNRIRQSITDRATRTREDATYAARVTVAAHLREQERRLRELEQLVLHLADWAAYENSVHAKPEHVARIREIRARHGKGRK